MRGHNRKNLRGGQGNYWHDLFTLKWLLKVAIRSVFRFVAFTEELQDLLCKNSADLQDFRTFFLLLYNNLNLSLFYAAFCQIYHSGPLMSLVNFDVLSLIHTSRFFRYSWVLMWNDTVYKTKWSGLEPLKSRHSHFHTSFHPCVQYYTLFLLLQTWPEASAL